MLPKQVQSGTLSLFLLQTLQHEICEFVTGVHVVRHMDFLLQNVVEIELAPNLEGDSSYYQFVDQQTQRPDVHFGVVFLLPDCFRRVVERSAAGGSAHEVVPALGSPSEIANLDDALANTKSTN
jgi:hypothetical protein